MKIISKFKDYYDYLQGIYGIDEKLILDRTEFYKSGYYPYKNSVIRFWICGNLVEGLFDGEKFLYGNELEELASNNKKQGKGKFSYYINQRRRDADLFYYIYFSEKRDWEKIAKRPIPFGEIPRPEYEPFKDIKEELCPNDKFDCPILLDRGINDPIYVKFPILSEYDFHKVYSAHDLWILLTEWLGREKIIPNNQTNAEKILSNGFDLKSSFRHPIK